jgi:hypothetical protein
MLLYGVVVATVRCNEMVRQFFVKPYDVKSN